MSVAELVRAARELPPSELTALTTQLVQLDNAAWDEQMDVDAASGKLDRLFEEAERERVTGTPSRVAGGLRSQATSGFWKQYAALPADIQKLARKNYSLWQNDQNHPSRAFKKLKGGNGSRFSIRIGDHYRAIAQLTGDAVEWVWIGSHEDYNKL